MDPREFLRVAAEWATGDSEADWRSAVSRAYYAVHHVGRDLLVSAGFAIPDGPAAHGAVWLRLANAGQVDVVAAGNTLKLLRNVRNQADYNLGTPFPQKLAIDQTEAAHDIIQLLDQLAATPTVLAQVVAAIRVYEQNVLREVTYRSP
jgi:uncharacterized protein (UPF0332 family)